MTSVFTLVAAFVGGMSVAMDTLAGERERRSLVPLLMNPLTRGDVIVGKWLAVSFFCLAGLALNLAGFGIVLHLPAVASATILITLVPLAMMASAIELAISTACRATKEAHTYLSLLVFLPMGLGIFLVFFPVAEGWRRWAPVVGQQWVLEHSFVGRGVAAVDVAMLASCTLAVIAGVLWITSKLLERDDVVYGN